MTLANPNIPEAVRAVAADGTQLRYTLMEMAAQMDDIITLGRGDPDLPTPPHIVEAANRAMREQQTGLTPVKGLPQLRNAIAEHMRAENGLPVGAENVMMTTGKLPPQTLMSCPRHCASPAPRCTVITAAPLVDCA